MKLFLLKDTEYKKPLLILIVKKAQPTKKVIKDGIDSKLFKNRRTFTLSWKFSKQNCTKTRTFADDTSRTLSGMRWFSLRTFQNRGPKILQQIDLAKFQWSPILSSELGNSQRWKSTSKPSFPFKRIILSSRNLKTQTGKVFRGGPVSHRQHKVKFILWTS